MKIKKSGISLIVLAITVIVMIILASAVILTLTHSDVMDKAERARSQSDMATLKDIVAIANSEWIVMTKEERQAEGPTFSDYAEKMLEKEGIEKGTYEITPSGKIYLYPIIPKGFIASDKEGENTVENGLVIYEGTAKVSTDTDAQTTRNQFVWIPVPDITEFVRRDGYQEGQVDMFVTNGVVVEPLNVPYNGITLSINNDLTGEWSEYEEMKESVEQYGGFYIARYEAGDGDATENRTTCTPAHTVVSKKNAYVYNHVPWGESMISIAPFTKNNVQNVAGAVELSRNMYKNNSTIESHLIYGVEWDAVMNFVQDIYNPNVPGKKYIEDDTGMGNYGTLQATGVNDNYKVKNIYDMSGNAHDTTMEATTDERRIHRGGAFNNPSGKYPASNRGANAPSYTSSVVSFRVALYLV